MPTRNCERCNRQFFSEDDGRTICGRCGTLIAMTDEDIMEEAKRRGIVALTGEEVAGQ